MENERLKALEELFKKFLPYDYEQKYNDRLAKLNLMALKSKESHDQKKVEYYESLIEEEKENHKKLSVVRRQMYDSLGKIRRLAEEKALIEILDGLVYRGKLIDNKKSYRKIYTHTSKPLMASVRKINEEMYKLLKKNQYLKISHEEFEDTFISWSIAYEYDLSDVTRKYSIGMDNLFNQYFSNLDTENRYDPSKLGLDANRLENLRNAFYDDTFNERNVSERSLYDKFKLLDMFVTNYNMSKYYGLRKEYEEICQISKKIWAIEEIEQLFSKTSIGKSEILLSVSKAKESYIAELSKLTNKADKKYEELHVEDVKQNLARLQELYIQYRATKNKFYGLKLEDYSGARKLDNVIDDIRREMKIIIGKYPELDSSEYQECIKSNMEIPLVKKEANEEKEEDKKTTVVDEPKQPLEPSKPIEEVPQPVVSQGPKEEDLTTKIKLTEYEHASWMEYYQKYIIEKMKQSDLGNMPFSKFLEKVAPQEKSLIEKEREREKQSDTIYKQYLKYFAGLSKEDKPYALTFKQFAMKKFGRDDIDLPMEHEEEYEEMRSSWQR